MKHDLIAVGGRRRYFDEDRPSLAALVDTVQHQAVQVHIQVGGQPEALDQSDRASVGLEKWPLNDLSSTLSSCPSNPTKEMPCPRCLMVRLHSLPEEAPA